MIFTKLKMSYFGKFKNREIELKPGINLIHGDNEAGKSTLHTFIRGMLFGIERLRGRGSASKEDIYTRYLPWEYPGAYGGSMEVRIGDRDLRIQRSFHANDKSLKITDLSNGREVKLKEGLISELVPGLTEATFKNTISIEQLKAQTDSELAAQVRNYITNLSISKSKEVDVAKAVSNLTDQRKQLEASQNPGLLKAYQEQIEDGLLKEERMDKLTLQLRELLEEEQKIKKQKEIVISRTDNEDIERIEQLPAILEKYRSYKELLRQESSLQLQTRELQDKITVWEKELEASSDLKEDITKLQKLQDDLALQEKCNLELRKDKERLNKETGKNLLFSLVPCLILGLMIVASTGFQIYGLSAFALISVAGIVGYLVLNQRLGSKQEQLKEQMLQWNQQTERIQIAINQLLAKYRISQIRELTVRQEEIIRNSYALEHAKEQVLELVNRQRELEDSLDILYDTIMKYIQHFIGVEELTDEVIQKLQSEIYNKRQESTGKLADMNRQQESIKLNIEKLRWEISSLEGNEEELIKNKIRYQELEQKMRDNAAELEAVKLALSSIEELASDIHDSFGQRLNKAVSDVISEVTENRYHDLKVDEKLGVKVGWNGDYVLLERLSAGTIDQVYFALRIAVADLLLGKDEVPLMLDDSFALYDDRRVRAALSELAHRKQTILFTCHKREQEILKELGIPYHLVELSCS